MLFVFITWLLEADKLAGNNESIMYNIYKGQLLIKATFSGILEWPLYTGLSI
jgi:hypothetical protein